MQHAHNLAGSVALPRQYTRDQFMTFDQATFDSAGAFLVSQLEKLDPKVHEPLVAVTWARDIELRPDIQISDEWSSFTTTAWGVAGSPDSGQGISYASGSATNLATPQIDIEKEAHPLTPWALAVQYSVLDLERSRRLGTPIDAQKLTVLNTKHQMDVDQLVYIGDPLRTSTGLINSSKVTPSNVPNGAAASPLWSLKTPTEILADFNAAIYAAWSASAFAVIPSKFLIAPKPFGYIASTVVSSAGNRTILDFLLDNNILTAERGVRLDIKSCKWLDKNYINGPGQAAATYDRMICYAQDVDVVRYAMAPLMPLAPQPNGMYIVVPYVGLVGEVEVVRPQPFAYRDAIN